VNQKSGVVIIFFIFLHHNFLRQKKSWHRCKTITLWL